MTGPQSSGTDGSEPRFLITGANGCIGAWVVHELVHAGRSVTTFDLAVEPTRLRMLLGDRVDSIAHVAGDVADAATLGRALDSHHITHIVHLAALQVPFVRADPYRGARVNVLGTINVFEAAKQRGLAPVVYASSIAAYDLAGTMCEPPSTLYGVFKRSNEATAAVYHAEGGVASIGLRPHTVFGVGRDQGLTSAPTSAMLAAAAGTRFTIPYGGVAQLQLAKDVARAFIWASVAAEEGASVHNLPGHVVSMADVVAAIRDVVPDAQVDHQGDELPLPAETDSTSFHTAAPRFVQTPLAEGVRVTIEHFEKLIARGLVRVPR
jgi:nucleoside-diphosphate-sugar epimerase